MGYDIKRKMETLQTDVDTVETGEIAAAAVTQAKLSTTRITGGMMIEPSGSDLWIKSTTGAVMIAGTETEIVPQHMLCTVATTGTEKLGIVEASGDGVAYVKYGTEVDEGHGTATYPDVDTGCIQIAKLFTAPSGSTINSSVSAVAATDIDNASSRF